MKPKPIAQEVPFHFEDLFFSTTDDRGMIQYGNNVFVEISGYSEDQIIGAPHNIIRHPDMPKSIFKLFWQTLKSGSPIGAYVKNMTADGRYYWVFAFAYPVSNGYLSIRFKPSSELFKTVQDLYQEILTQEKATSMEEGEALLQTRLNDLGFKTYEEFMIEAAIVELKSREEHLNDQSQNAESSDPIVSQITKITLTTKKALDKSFAKIDQFQSSSSLFAKNIIQLNNEFKKLKFLSMNMSIMAAQYGEATAVLGVISTEFSKVAAQIEAHMEIFSEFTVNLLEMISSSSLNLAALKTQMIMVDFFVKESIGLMKTRQNAFAGMISNQEIFTNLFSLSIQHLNEQMSILAGKLITVESQISEIGRFTSGLEIIKQTGAIESSRQDDIKKAFTIYLVEMGQFTNLLRTAMIELTTQREDLQYNTKVVQESTYQIQDNIDHIFKLALQKIE